MMYKKVVVDGYILGVGEVATAGNIGLDEYERLTNILNNMPTAPEGYYCVLRDSDGEWELIKTPDEQQEVNDSEALQILLGGESDA